MKRYLYILLGLLCLVMFFIKLGSVPLIGMDESLYSEASRGMSASGNYIVPHYNGGYFFDKPPLVYWMQAACINVFGVNSFAVRLPSAVAGILLVALVVFLGTRIFSAKTGILSGFVLASSILAIMLSRMSIIDQTFALTITLTLGTFILVYLKKLPGWGYILSWAFMGLSVMAKGPAGAVLIGITIFVFLLIRKDIKTLFKPVHLLGILTFLAVVCPWFYLVQNATGGKFFYEFFIHQNIARALGKDFYHNMPFYYYLPVFLIGFFPWSIFVPAAWAGSVKIKSNDEKQIASLFLAVWSAVIIIIFSISKSKLPAYIYPMYPAAALMVGFLWSKLIGYGKNVKIISVAALISLIFAAILAVGFVYASTKLPDPIPGLPPVLIFMGISMLVTTIAAYIYCKKADYKRAFASLCACIFGFMGVVIFMGLPVLSKKQGEPIVKAANIIKRNSTSENKTVIIYEQPRFYSLPFYAERKITFANTPEELSLEVTKSEHGVLVSKTKIPNELLENMKSSARANDFIFYKW